MGEGTVVPLPRPSTVLADNPLLAVLREGARRMLTQAAEAQVEAFLTAHVDLTDDRGRRRLVRNGHAPERHFQTGIGPLAVRRPRVRDRGEEGSGGRSASARPSCRPACGGPETWRSCCPGSRRLTEER